MTKQESLFAGVPGIKSVATLLEEQMPEITRKTRMADDFLQQTIFPTTIVKDFLRLPNAKIDTYVSYPQWETNPYSAVIAFFYDTRFIEKQYDQDDDTICDVYIAKAIAVEMNPNGVLTLHGEDSEEHPKIELSIDEWRNNKKSQKNAFWRTFVTPSEIIYQIPLSSSTFEVHD